jgi:hypothetical protein
MTSKIFYWINNVTVIANQVSMESIQNCMAPIEEQASNDLNQTLQQLSTTSSPIMQQQLQMKLDIYNQVIGESSAMLKTMETITDKIIQNMV